jgi:hypothetical protein
MSVWAQILSCKHLQLTNHSYFNQALRSRTKITHVDLVIVVIFEPVANLVHSSDSVLQRRLLYSASESFLIRGLS